MKGSLGSDPNNLRGDAANLLLDISPNDQLVAVGFFAKAFPPDVELKPRLLSDKYRRELAESLRNPPDRGLHTALLESLGAAARMSLVEAEQGRSPYILLLTDGGESEIKYKEAQKTSLDLAERYLKRSNAHVTTVGLGGQADHAMLSNIVRRAGSGFDYKANSAKDLLLIYEWYIAQFLQRSRVEASEIRFPFAVRNATALVIKEPNQKSHALIGLEGSSSRIDRNTPGVFASTAGHHYELLRVDNLASGSWKVLTTGQSPRISWMVEMPITLEIVTPKAGQVPASLPLPFRTRFVSRTGANPGDISDFLSAVTVNVTITNRSNNRSKTYTLKPTAGDKSMFESTIDPLEAGLHEVVAVADYKMPQTDGPVRMPAQHQLIEAIDPQLRLRFAKSELVLDSPLASIPAVVELQHALQATEASSLAAAAEFVFGIARENGAPARPPRQVSAAELAHLKIDASDKLQPGRYVVSIEGKHANALISGAKARLEVKAYTPPKNPVAILSARGKPALNGTLSVDVEIIRPDDRSPLAVGDAIDKEGIWIFDGLADATLTGRSHLHEDRQPLTAPAKGGAKTAAATFPLKFPGEFKIDFGGKARVRNSATRATAPELPITATPEHVTVLVPDQLSLDQPSVDATLRSEAANVTFALTGAAALHAKRTLVVMGAGDARSGGATKGGLPIPANWISSAPVTINPSTASAVNQAFKLEVTLQPDLEVVEVTPGLFETELLVIDVDKAKGNAIAEAVVDRVPLRLTVEARRPKPTMFAVNFHLPRIVDVAGHLVVFEGPPPPNQEISENERPYQIVLFSKPDQKPVKVGDPVLGGKYRVASITFAKLHPNANRMEAIPGDKTSSYQTLSFTGTDEIPLELGVTEVVFAPTKGEEPPIAIEIGITEQFTIKPSAN